MGVTDRNKVGGTVKEAPFTSSSNLVNSMLQLLSKWRILFLRIAALY